MDYADVEGTRHRGRFGVTLFLPMLWRPATRIQLDVRLPPAEAERRLRSSMAIVPSVLLSPTWGRTEEIVGRIDGSRFVMRARHGYSNGLTRLLYGAVTGRTTGSRVEGEFRTLLWVVLILRFVWIVFLSQVLFAPRSPSGLIPLAALLFVVIVEIVGRSLGDEDERKMRDHLKLIFVDVS
jgi:hypothetical protein